MREPFPRLPLTPRISPNNININAVMAQPFINFHASFYLFSGISSDPTTDRRCSDSAMVTVSIRNRSPTPRRSVRHRSAHSTKGCVNILMIPTATGAIRISISAAVAPKPMISPNHVAISPAATPIPAEAAPRITGDAKIHKLRSARSYRWTFLLYSVEIPPVPVQFVTHRSASCAVLCRRLPHWNMPGGESLLWFRH